MKYIFELYFIQRKKYFINRSYREYICKHIRKNWHNIQLYSERNVCGKGPSSRNAHWHAWNQQIWSVFLCVSTYIFMACHVMPMYSFWHYIGLHMIGPCIRHPSESATSEMCITDVVLFWLCSIYTEVNAHGGRKEMTWEKRRAACKELWNESINAKNGILI